MTVQSKYETNIRRSLAEMYQHMSSVLLDFLDDEGTLVDTNSLTDSQLDSIESVRAIDEEWVIDAKTREEISLLTFEDDEEDR